MQNQVQFAPLQRSEDICFVYYAYSVANKIALCEKETVLYRKNTDGLEANKDKLPTEPCQAWLLLCEKLKARDLFDRVKQSFVNAAVNGFMYNISQFATGEAFAQCYSEFVGRVVPALDINLADAGYFYNRQHYDYLKELVDDGSCLNHLHKYYKLYTGLQKRGNSQKVEKKVENRGTQNKHEQSKCDCIGCFITFIPRKIRGGGDAIASTACGTHGTVCCSISASRSDRELRKKVRTETEIYQTKFKLEETGHGRENQGIGHYSGI